MAFEKLSAVKEAESAFYDEDGKERGKIILHDSSGKSLLQLKDERFINSGDTLDYEFEEVQLLEGRRYYFEIETDSNYFFDFSQSPLIQSLEWKGESRSQSGILETGIHTGVISLHIHNESTGAKAFTTMEVQSLKSGSMRDFREMLSFISSKCNDLLLQIQSPALGRLESDDTKDVETLTQRFYFLRSLLDAPEFQNAVSRVIRNPHARSEGMEVERALSRGGLRIGPREALQIARKNPRVDIPPNHPLFKRNGVATLPRSIITVEHRESVDIPENRFVKFALRSFESVLEEIKIRIEQDSSSKEGVIAEITTMQCFLEEVLSHSFFKSLSDLTQLPLASPVLQRKEGYRDILKVWLQLELAASIVWDAGKELFKGGLRDVATLYEYWLFFKLLESVDYVFEMRGLPVDERNNEFISLTDNGLGLQLKTGERLRHEGTYPKGADNPSLNVSFSYNRTFKGGEKSDRASEGSWTKYMRPDYTISLWPYAIKDPGIAEKQEKMVHLHFDAKYRIANPHNSDSVVDIVKLFQDHLADDEELFGEDDEKGVEEEERAARLGIASKRSDLLKMHAYRDAIRRTEGAYVLYPGSSDKEKGWRGYHELLPGIGAFPVCPGSAEDMDSVRRFLKDSADLCVDRFSQLYRQRHWTRKIMDSDQYAPYGLAEYPADMDDYRKRFFPNDIDMPPEDVGVIVGFIRRSAMSACRLPDGRGHFYFYAVDRDGGTSRLDSKVFSAQYLMPYTKDASGTIEWLDWYARITGFSLKPRSFLEDDLGIPIESDSQFYYLMELQIMPDVNDMFRVIKDPSRFLPRKPHRPRFFTLSELWG